MSPLRSPRDRARTEEVVDVPPPAALAAVAARAADDKLGRDTVVIDVGDLLRPGPVPGRPQRAHEPPPAVKSRPTITVTSTVSV